MSQVKCPVCESALDFSPWQNGVSSHGICPSCGIHFGYNDARSDLRSFVYSEWRREWDARGRRPISGPEWKEVAASVLQAAQARLRTN